MNNLNKNQQFVALPIKKQESLKKYEILIYVCIRRYMNSKTLEAWPSIATIAKESGCARKTVLEIIERIEEKGYIKVIKKGRCNHYLFNNEKHFEPFSYEFLDNPNLTKSEKLQILCTQQYMDKTSVFDENGEEQGVGTICMSDSQLAKCTGLERHTISKNNKSLIDKGFATQISLQTRDSETGLINKQTVYNLNAIGQAIVFALRNHEQRINDHDDRLSTLEKEIAQLRRELFLRDVETVKPIKEFEF